MIIKVALAQLRRPKTVAAARDQVIAVLARAKRRRADLVLFAEGQLSGYAAVDHPLDQPPDWDEVDKALKEIARACRRLKIGAALGSGVSDRGRVFNRLMLLDKRGRPAGHYDKTHLFARDARLYQRGRKLDVHRFAGAPLGLLICYDHRFPEPWRVLAAKGAAAILHASCHYGPDFTWKRPVVEGHLRSRAAENGCYVLSVNRGDRWPAWGSVAYDPEGRLIARAPYGREALVVVAVDPARAHHRFLRQRRTDLY